MNRLRDLAEDQQPLMPVVANDLAPTELRGRFNAAQPGAFRAGGIAGPLMASVLLRDGVGSIYIAVTVFGCAVVAALSLTWERTIPSRANGADRQPTPMNGEMP